MTTAVESNEMEELYAQYGKPLEDEHPGEYLAVSPDGETLLAPTLLGAVQKSTAAFGRGNYIFKIGERTVGKWR